MDATYLAELLEAARNIVEDPWVVGADDLDDEDTDLWPGDFTPHYHGDWREVGHPDSLIPVVNYYTKPDEPTGLGSGSDLDWTTPPGAHLVAAVLLLRVGQAAPSAEQIKDFAQLISARAEHDGEWTFDHAEVEGWLAGLPVAP